MQYEIARVHTHMHTHAVTKYTPPQVLEPASYTCNMLSMNVVSSVLNVHDRHSYMYLAVVCTLSRWGMRVVGTLLSAICSMIPVVVLKLETALNDTLIELSDELLDTKCVSAYSYCAGSAPFKFMLSKQLPYYKLGKQRVFPRAMSSLCLRLRNWADTSKEALLVFIRDTETMSRVARLISGRTPFSSMGSSNISNAAARAVFGMLVSCSKYDDSSSDGVLKALLLFWMISSRIDMCSCDICPAGLHPFECDYMRHGQARIDESTAPFHNVISRSSVSNLFVSSIRELLCASTCNLVDSLVPCGNRTIKTPGYDVNLDAVHVSISRIARLQLGVSDHVDAFALASLCNGSIVSCNSFISLVNNLKYARAFEPPSSAASFAWIATCACFHAMSEESVGAIAEKTVEIIRNSTADTRCVEASLRRLVLIAVSSRIQRGFQFILSNTSMVEAACSALEHTNGMHTFFITCLDMYSESPSGLMELPSGGSAEELLRIVGNSFCCYRPDATCESKAKVRSLRRFVAIDSNLVTNDSTVELVTGLNVELEQVLGAMEGPLSFMPTWDDATHIADLSVAFRRKTIAAIREAFRFRVCSYPTQRVLLVAWVSENSSCPRNCLALFARTFVSCTNVQEHSACFDFEDDLRRALKSTTCIGTHGRVNKNMFLLPTIDRLTEEALENRDQAVLCTRIHTPLNGHVSVSVVSTPQ